MKEFRVEPLEVLLKDICEELKEFEELKECYVEGNKIIMRGEIIIRIAYDYNGVKIDNDWNNVWRSIKLKASDVFDEVASNLKSIKIKEPKMG